MARKFLLLINVIILFSIEISIAANKYMNADNYLKNGDYDSALNEYVTIIEEKGPISNSRDIHALTGAFISLFMKQEYKKSFALCKQVLKYQSYNSTAIFYAGQNISALGKLETAKKLFKYYQVLPYSDPYRSLIQARYNFLIKNELEKKIIKATQLEGRVSSQKLPENSVAVIYLVNDSESQSWDPLSKGLTELIITDLSYIKSLSVIQRSEIQILIDQLKFTPTDLLDENLIPRLGRLLNSKTIISGHFVINNNSRVDINLGVLNLAEPNSIEYIEFQDHINNILQLEKQMIMKVVEKLGVVIQESEKKNIMKFQTKNLNAFLAYCDGLIAYDRGDFEIALTNFAKSSKLDPGFTFAVDMHQHVDALILIDQGNLALKHFDIVAKKMTAPSFGFGSSYSNTRERLTRICYNLNLGFLPGVEARDGITSIDLSNLDQLDLHLLGEPPDPPGN